MVSGNSVHRPQSTKDVLRYYYDNVSSTTLILILLGILIVFVGLCALCYRLYRRKKKKKGYVPVDEYGIDEVYVHHSLKQNEYDTQKEVQMYESPTLNPFVTAATFCKNSRGLYNTEPVQLLIGCRPGKYWFKVTNTDDDIASLLYTVNLHKNIKKLNDSMWRKNLQLVFQEFSRHPYILEVEYSGYMLSRKALCLVRPLGISLKDVMYRCKPTNSYRAKYVHSKAVPLTDDLIARYGRHILEALSAFRSVGCILNCIKAENIVIIDNCAKISEYENCLIGLEPSFRMSDYYDLHKNVPVDLGLFGRILFQMKTGEELSTSMPDFVGLTQPSLEYMEVMEKIFHAKRKKSKLTPKKIARLDFFRIDEVAGSPKLHFSESMLDIISGHGKSKDLPREKKRRKSSLKPSKAKTSWRRLSRTRALN